MHQSVICSDLSSFEKFYEESRAEDIQVGTECANVAKCQRCRFFVGVKGQAPPENFIFFMLKKKLYLQHSETMKQQITPGLGKSKRNQKYDTVHFSKPNIDLHKNGCICTIIFWLTDLHEGKKCDNVALRKVENTHDHKYKLEIKQ